jgi:hypothetical protein
LQQSKIKRWTKSKKSYTYLSSESLDGLLSPGCLQSSNINILFSLPLLQRSIVKLLWTRNTSQHRLTIPLHPQSIWPKNTDQRHAIHRKKKNCTPKWAPCSIYNQCMQCLKWEKGKIELQMGSVSLRSRGLLCKINVEGERKREVTINGGMRGGFWSVNKKKQRAPFFKNNSSLLHYKVYTASQNE